MTKMLMNTLDTWQSRFKQFVMLWRLFLFAAYMAMRCGSVRKKDRHLSHL